MSTCFWLRAVVLSCALVAACGGKASDPGTTVVTGGSSGSGGTPHIGLATGGAATAGKASGGASSIGLGGKSSGGGATGGSARAGEADGPALGEPCLPDDEQVPNFSGFALSEINFGTMTRACASGLCLANHFQGRVSCPYGQETADGACTLPGSETPVAVQVRPQLKERPASSVVTCSCRCDGAGAGPYCACPETMECVPLFTPPLVPSGGQDLAGSYCILKGTTYDPAAPNTACDAQAMDCGEAHPY